MTEPRQMTKEELLAAIDEELRQIEILKARCEAYYNRIDNILAEKY